MSGSDTQAPAYVGAPDIDTDIVEVRPLNNVLSDDTVIFIET